MPAWVPLLVAMTAAAVFVIGNQRIRRTLGGTTWVFGRTDTALDFVGRAHRIAIGMSMSGLVLNAILPAEPTWSVPTALAWSGTAGMLAGTAVLAWAQRAMGRSWRIGIPDEATALVTTGPFAYSRNPTFLGFVLLLGGAAAAAPGPLTVAGAAAGFVAFSVQIRLEEDHLTMRHGEAYVAYRRRVGRWLGAGG